MSVSSRAPATGKMPYWAGWAMTGVVIVFLLFDATIKLMALPTATETGADLGFPGAGMARG